MGQQNKAEKCLYHEYWCLKNKRCKDSSRTLTTSLSTHYYCTVDIPDPCCWTCRTSIAHGRTSLSASPSCPCQMGGDMSDTPPGWQCAVLTPSRPQAHMEGPFPGFVWHPDLKVDKTVHIYELFTDLCVFLSICMNCSTIQQWYCTAVCLCMLVKGKQRMITEKGRNSEKNKK